MKAIAFVFEINKSFLEYSHLITIPTIYNKKLRRTGLDQELYKITYPEGEVLKATMYHGKGDQDNEYYRLTVPKRYQRLPDYLQIKDTLIVVLTKDYKKNNYAILEYMQVN